MATPVQPPAKKRAVKQSAWKALAAHYKTVSNLHLRQLFADDPNRGQRMAVEAVGLYLDYSKNRVTDETLKLLLQLAEESGLRARIDAMFSGEKINITEKRAVLHVALRAPKDPRSSWTEKTSCLKSMPCSTGWLIFPIGCAVASGKATPGKRIRNVVNIGIGGSDLGPVMAYEALEHYSERSMTFRFVSNVDGTDFAEAVRGSRSGGDPVHRFFKNLHNSGNHDECSDRARLVVGRTGRRREIGCQAFCRGFDECGGSLEVRH